MDNGSDVVVMLMPCESTFGSLFLWVKLNSDTAVCSDTVAFKRKGKEKVHSEVGFVCFCLRGVKVEEGWEESPQYGWKFLLFFWWKVAEQNKHRIMNCHNYPWTHSTGTVRNRFNHFSTNWQTDRSTFNVTAPLDGSCCRCSIPRRSGKVKCEFLEHQIHEGQSDAIGNRHISSFNMKKYAEIWMTS